MPPRFVTCSLHGRHDGVPVRHDDYSESSIVGISEKRVLLSSVSSRLIGRTVGRVGESLAVGTRSDQEATGFDAGWLVFGFHFRAKALDATKSLLE
jgi:hypothetical protein